MCITDHHTTRAKTDVAKLNLPAGFLLVIGMEYTTPDGDFLIIGPELNALPSHLTSRELLPMVHSQGGIAIAAHPCRSDKTIPEKLFEDGLCHCAEMLNGRNPSPANDRASLLCGRFSLVATGGSDAHFPGELGSFATQFQNRIKTECTLVDALYAGLCHPVRLPLR